MKSEHSMTSTVHTIEEYVDFINRDKKNIPLTSELESMRLIVRKETQSKTSELASYAKHLSRNERMTFISAILTNDSKVISEMLLKPLTNEFNNVNLSLSLLHHIHLDHSMRP